MMAGDLRPYITGAYSWLWAQTIILTRSRSDSEQDDDDDNEGHALSACGCIAMIAGVRCSCLLQVMATTPSLRFRYRSRKA